jgi:hypothetical protein
MTDNATRDIKPRIVVIGVGSGGATLSTMCCGRSLRPQVRHRQYGRAGFVGLSAGTAFSSARA